MLKVLRFVAVIVAVQLAACAGEVGVRSTPGGEPRVGAQPDAVQASELYTYRAVVRRVIDGDTLDVDIDLGMHIWLHDERLRLARINAPELKGAERERGVAARDWLNERLNGQRVLIRTSPGRGEGYDEKEKYGRYLAEIILDGVNINDELVRRGLAEYRKY